MGSLMARWLEGSITYQPAYLGPYSEPETLPLVPALAAFNRAGFVTAGSQPGYTEDGYAQRASVDAFCDPEIAARVERCLLGTDLVVLADPPGALHETKIPVSRLDGEAVTWAGGGLTFQEIGDFYAECHPEGVAALRTAWWVVVIDPVWGRRDELWPHLGAAVGIEPRAVRAMARREEILAMAARHGAGDVRVFGSVARGEAEHDSNLDLLVRFGPGASLLDLAGLQLDLTELLGVPVDVVDEGGLRETDSIVTDAVPL